MKTTTAIISIILALILLSSSHPPTTAASSRHVSFVGPPRKQWNTNCSFDAQVEINQGLESTSGIPRFGVMIVNMCSNCSVKNVHVRCGWFASANLVNPQQFKRIAYDDCIVNGGRAMEGGSVIRFTYSNTRRYDLSVSSYNCC